MICKTYKELLAFSYVDSYSGCFNNTVILLTIFLYYQRISQVVSFLFDNFETFFGSSSSKATSRIEFLTCKASLCDIIENWAFSILNANARIKTYDSFFIVMWFGLLIMIIVKNHLFMANNN